MAQTETGRVSYRAQGTDRNAHAGRAPRSL